MEKESGERQLIILNATDLKENIQMIRRMELELLLGSLETFIMVLTSMTNVWATVKCTGPTVQSTKVNGKREFKTVVVSCLSQTAESKMAISKTTFSKETPK